ncbi:Target of rapamycin complex 2 subunit sin1 [Golovinomyces cichoracearum]|uniref:Target of rapamycin complex 2 subunit sin1 n=1 Tax=Golovinomyces cichoracearum TaxID=62708 RepID=A0A420HIC3_9PEZI|nr:Target of rapamycin complex 2 subunit sin1 [Golovinomyces cichoracearum]
MSIIQVEDLVSYQLRTNYLETISDGVGERLISLNNAYHYTAGTRIAGWRQIPAHKLRTHSPPIPTAIASEYFQTPPKLTKKNSGCLDEDVLDNELVSGGAGGYKYDTSEALKRTTRREQIEEEDSSDISEESDDEVEQTSTQQIKFSKMPIRRRSGSSPMHESNLRLSSTMSPLSEIPAIQDHRSSQSVLGFSIARTRTNTITSGEISSDNEFDASAFHRNRTAARNLARSKMFLNQSSDSNVVNEEPTSTLLKVEVEDDSDESGMDSDFAGSLDSATIIPGINSLISGSLDNVVGTLPRALQKSPTKKSRPAPTILTALPPARPISTIQPKSLLSAAIKAKRAKASMPFESFASLSGQAESNPLNIRIWAPFSTSSTKFYEVLIRRNVHESDVGDRQVTVVDLIGLSLWRYGQEKLEPPLPKEKLNINRWTLRLVEDEEVDYDFPALYRTKPVVAFSTVNNRAVRSRSGTKPYDEFALVEATDEEFTENQKITSQFKEETAIQNDDTPPNLNKPVSLPAPSFTSITSIQSRQNPVLNPKIFPHGSVILADTPAVDVTTTNNSNRTGPKKHLRIHINSTDTAPGQMITLDVTTDTYLADVLDIICKKRQLDKAAHVLKLTGSGTLVLLDRTVESIGNRIDLDLARRRFATDGPLTMTGSPSSSSPKTSLTVERPESRKFKKSNMMSPHPLAQHSMKQDEVGSANYCKYTVWRKQPMRFVGMNERLLVIDGEYLHIMPASTGKTLFDGQGKTTTVHFSNIIGCKITRRHPSNFKVVIFRTTETKRYDFEAKSSDEAADIIFEINKGISPYHNA